MTQLYPYVISVVGYLGLCALFIPMHPIKELILLVFLATVYTDFHSRYTQFCIVIYSMCWYLEDLPMLKGLAILGMVLLVTPPHQENRNNNQRQPVIMGYAQPSPSESIAAYTNGMLLVTNKGQRFIRIGQLPLPNKLPIRSITKEQLNYLSHFSGFLGQNYAFQESVINRRNSGMLLVGQRVVNNIINKEWQHDYRLEQLRYQLDELKRAGIRVIPIEVAKGFQFLLIDYGSWYPSHFPKEKVIARPSMLSQYPLIKFTLHQDNHIAVTTDQPVIATEELNLLYRIKNQELLQLGKHFSTSGNHVFELDGTAWSVPLGRIMLLSGLQSNFELWVEQYITNTKHPVILVSPASHDRFAKLPQGLVVLEEPNFESLRNILLLFNKVETDDAQTEADILDIMESLQEWQDTDGEITSLQQLHDLLIQQLDNQRMVTQEHILVAILGLLQRIDNRRRVADLPEGHLLLLDSRNTAPVQVFFQLILLVRRLGDCHVIIDDHRLVSVLGRASVQAEFNSCSVVLRVSRQERIPEILASKPHLALKTRSSRSHGTLMTSAPLDILFLGKDDEVVLDTVKPSPADDIPIMDGMSFLLPLVWMIPFSIIIAVAIFVLGWVIAQRKVRRPLLAEKPIALTPVLHLYHGLEKAFCDPAAEVIIEINHTGQYIVEEGTP